MHVVSYVYMYTAKSVCIMFILFIYMDMPGANKHIYIRTCPRLQRFSIALHSFLTTARAHLCDRVGDVYCVNSDNVSKVLVLYVTLCIATEV